MGTMEQVTTNKHENSQENLSARHEKESTQESRDSTYDRIMTLQRTMGNEAVGQLLSSGELQAKLTVGRPGDRYEVEADQVADKVMGMSASTVQREEGEEEADISPKPINRNLQREPEEDEETIQTSSVESDFTQMTEDEDDVQAKVRRQMQILHRASNGSSRTVTSDTESKIQNLRGGGSPMSDSSREFFEPRFGYDFSSVKIHTGSSAADTAQSINARAYTLGNNVVFNKGEYSPETSGGKHLMAHELTHVVQQGAAKVRKKRKTIHRKPSPYISRKTNEAVTSIKRKPEIIDTQSNFHIPFRGDSVLNSLQREATEDEEIKAAPAIQREAPEEEVQEKHLVQRNSTEEELQETPLIKRDSAEEEVQETPLVQRDSAEEEVQETPLVQRESVEEEVQEKPVSVTSSKPVVQRGLLERIRNSVLSKLNQIPGFGFISIITGRNLITGRRVRPTANNIIRAILGTTIYGKLNRYRAITKAVNWVTGQVTRLRLRPADIGNAFSRMVRYARNNTWTALTSPLATLRRFIGPVIRNALIFVARVRVQINSIISRAWLRFKMWALRSMLTRAGSEGRKIYQMMSRGRGTLARIARRPGRFFRNFMRGVRMGFTRFKTNFVRHFRNAIFNWLFGVMQGTDIQMPQKFDAKGIFSLVMQVLGLTWTRIRGMIVRQLGPRGEQIMGVLETSVTLVRDLVTRGPVVLLERVQQAIGNLGDMIKNAVIGWVRNTIVVRAVEYLLSMLNPAGAIFQLARGIYRVITFFMEKKDQIMGLFNSIVGSIGRIAMGNLGGAARFIENAMGRGLSLLISFLTRLLGLNGISAHIQRVINNIRRPIDNVINGVIRFVVGRARGLMGRVRSGARNVRDRAVNWWQKRKGFRAKDGSQHHVYFNRRGRRVVLMAASNDPNAVKEWLSREKRVLNGKRTRTQDENTKLAAIGRAENSVSTLESETAKLQNNRGRFNRNRRTAVRQIDALLLTLSDQLKAASYGVLLGQETLPPSKVTYQTKGNRAGWVKAWPLTKVSGNTTGSTPGQDPAGWQHISRIDPDTRFWVRMHLLNHNIHGPGVVWNLVPGRKTDNDTHKRQVENTVKNLVLNKDTSTNQYKIAYYNISVDYFMSGIHRNFPRVMNMEWGELEQHNQNYRKKRGTRRTYSLTMERPPLDTDVQVVDIKTASEARLKSVGLPADLAAAIQNERVENGAFRGRRRFMYRIGRRLGHSAFRSQYRSLIDALVRSGRARL